MFPSLVVLGPRRQSVSTRGALPNANLINGNQVVHFGGTIGRIRLCTRISAFFSFYSFITSFSLKRLPLGKGTACAFGMCTCTDEEQNHLGTFVSYSLRDPSLTPYVTSWCLLPNGLSVAFIWLLCDTRR